MDRKLPEGLHWRPRAQYDRDNAGLVLDGKEIAMLLQRVDLTWFARLECHWPIRAPLVLRDCTDLESGRRGCEDWAIRHLDRLRAEMAGRSRPRYLGEPQE